MSDDPIGAEKRRQRRLAEIRDANELARLLRESQELLLAVWCNEVDAAVKLQLGLPHRSEYPGHVPGDQQWYEQDEIALWRTHSGRPGEWSNRELGWPALLDKIHQDTLDAWRVVKPSLSLALRLPNEVRERINDPKERDAQQRLIAVLRDAESHLAQIIPFEAANSVLDSMEPLSPMTAWSVLSSYLEIQRAIVVRQESLTAELAPMTGSGSIDKRNQFAAVFGCGFKEDADLIDAFVAPIFDAASSLQQALKSESATNAVPFSLRPLTQDDLNLIRSLLEQFTNSCERCSATLTGKQSSNESAETLWNDAVRLLNQLLALIGPDSIGQFIIVDHELRRTLEKASKFVESQKKPFSRDLDYHGENAVAYLNWAAIGTRRDIINWLPESIDGGGNQSPPEPDKKPTPVRKRRKRRRSSNETPKPLTELQVEAIKLHGDCEGNTAEVARRMGISRKAAEQHIKLANKKLGKMAVQKKKTKSLPTDRRGQENLSEDDDRRE
jgi:predicted DNA-binding protein (UPF0251 family)